MLFAVKTTTNARKDIQDAIEWENKRKAGLADRFLADFEQKITILSHSPYIGSVRYENIRCVPTNIFQYLVHYIVNDDGKQVIILRVLHTSRKPNW